ncbi:MAG: hypothetical protein ACKVOK_13900 [Flavobacteriales bacterium]
MKSATHTKLKSNIALAVLLFVFGGLHAEILVGDTIILDGEKIYIEKSEMVTDLDSLQEEAMNDIKKDKKRESIIELTIEAGLNTTWSRFETSVNNQQTLDGFLGRKRSLVLNPDFGADIGVYLFRFPTSSGEKKLSLQAGIFRNQMCFKSTQMDAEQLEQDSIIRFYKTGENIQLEYFSVFDWGPPIIGEADTLQVNLSRNTTKVTATEIPVRLRYTQSINGNRMSWFAEAGVIYRITSFKTNDIQDNYLLNDDGQYERILASDFKVSNQLLPTLSLGVKWYSDACDKPKGKLADRLTYGALVRFVSPFSQVNEGSLYYFDAMNFSVNGFVGVYF